MKTKHSTTETPALTSLDPARLRALAAELRQPILTDRELVARTILEQLGADPDVTATALMDALKDAWLTTVLARIAPDMLETWAWMAEGNPRATESDPEYSASGAAALSAATERALERELARRAGRRFGNA